MQRYKNQGGCVVCQRRKSVEFRHKKYGNNSMLDIDKKLEEMRQEDDGCPEV